MSSLGSSLFREPSHGLWRFNAPKESAMHKKPDQQPDKTKNRQTPAERDVSDPHPGSVSDGTHPEANEDKTED